MESELNQLKKYISLTFDSDPKVRKEAAIKLSKIDDPGATFALLELSYDKDEEVANVAKSILSEKGKKEPKLMSFSEIFSKKEEVKDKHEENISYSKILEPINKILEKSMGKERAEKFGGKIIPQIIKGASTSKPVKKEVMQALLVAYLKEVGIEGISSKDPTKKDNPTQSQPLTSPLKTNESNPLDNKREKANVSLSNEKDEEEGVIEEVSSLLTEPEKMEREIEESKNDEYFTVEYEGEKIDFDSSMRPVFNIALSTFLETDNESIMKKQMENLKKFFDRQIDIAFKIAKEKLKKRKIVNITQIKDGMRRIYTDVLEILSIKKQVYPKTKRKNALMIRILVRDSDGNEGVIYLFDGRGSLLRPGMKIRVENGKAKYFSFSGETALVLTKTGKIVAEF